MKILAIEKELRTIDWEKESQVLIEEARLAYQLLLSGIIREIYFNQKKNAVLVLECTNTTEAKQQLSKLPLFKKGMIDFDLMELQPYTGFTRLMTNDEERLLQTT